MPVSARYTIPTNPQAIGPIIAPPAIPIAVPAYPIAAADLAPFKSNAPAFITKIPPVYIL
jgi:hypothetical protein